MRKAKDIADEYWGRPQAERAFIKFIKELQEEVLEHAKGEVDMVIGEDATKVCIKQRLDDSIKNL